MRKGFRFCSFVCNMCEQTKMTWYDKQTRKLYHADLGIPQNAQTQHGQVLLNYSQHALDAALDDRYGNIVNLPKSLDTSKAQVIEVEMQGSKTTKVVYRIPYNEEYDLVMVLVPDRRFVKTVWLNKNSDLHNTLDTSKYDIPETPQENEAVASVRSYFTKS